MNAAARIHVHKPWQHSTGPRTPAGKAIARMNALKHGKRSAAVLAERRAVKHYLRVQKEFLKQVRLLLRVQRQAHLKKSTNEVMIPALSTPIIDRLRQPCDQPVEARTMYGDMKVYMRIPEPVIGGLCLRPQL